MAGTYNMLHAVNLGKQVERARPRLRNLQKTAGQNPFTAGSKIATHSTCEVIGNRSKARSVRTR